MSNKSKVITLTDAISSEVAGARDTRYYESRMAPQREGALAIAMDALRDDTITLIKIAELQSKQREYLDSIIDECLINERSLDRFKAEIDSAFTTFFQ